MESFEQKIKERNNLLKSQVESLTGRNELTEVIDTLLKAGVSEEDLVEKAKYIRREADGKGGYKYIYSEPKEKQSGKKEEHEITFKNPDGSEGKRTIRIGNVSEKEAIDWAKEHIKGSDFKGSYKENKIKIDKVDKKEMSFNDFKELVKKDNSLYNSLSKEDYKNYTKGISEIGHPRTVHAKWMLYKNYVLGKK